MKRREALFTLGCFAFLPKNIFSNKERSEEMQQEIKTEKAPQAIGPYSQAIVANGFVFVSGQIPINPATGDLVVGTIEEQTSQVLKNLNAILEAAGSSLKRVVKTTVLLQDINDFSKMNQIYGDFFKPPYPARATFQVARLPKEAKIEIEAIALAGR